MRSKVGSRVLPVAIVVAIAAMVGFAALTAGAATPKERLELQKLRQEVRQLRIANEAAESTRRKILDWAPFITALVAVGGLVWPVTREIRAQREQREKELDQRRIEAERRFQELFAAAVANLGSEQESVQVSAVIALQSFLADDYKPFHEQVYQVLCANLGIDHSGLVNRFLVRAFAQSVRLRTAVRPGEPLDLARCQMQRIDLHEVMLEQADIAFAHLEHANLRDARLFRARGFGVTLDAASLTDATLGEARLHGLSAVRAHFHRADLKSAELRSTKKHVANLEEAEFSGAQLQSAHFDGANLAGAKFDGANLSDTFFTGASFDDVSMKSVLSARSVDGVETWRRAHFDSDVRERLEQLEARRGRSLNDAKT
jgi:uncharacterized protein YjbI with pentapeptide repeats